MATKFSLEGIKALIVDDYQPMRNVLRMVLRDIGIREIEDAKNGREALSKLKDFRADVVITDYKMAPINGAELIRKIRAGYEGVDSHTPIIVVSAYTDMPVIQKARDAGMTEFLAKPVSTKLLYMRLRSVIETPRPFVHSDDFFGPDRRRRMLRIQGSERRHYTDPPSDPPSATQRQTTRI